MTRVARPLNVLIVAKSHAVAQRWQLSLQQIGFAPHWELAQNEHALIKIMPQKMWDLILHDQHDLPELDDFMLMDCLRRYDWIIPVVLIAPPLPTPTMVELIRAGISDILTTDQLDRLEIAVERALQHKTKQIPYQKPSRFTQLFETVPVALWEQDWSAIKTALDTVKSQGIHDVPAYLDEHPDFIQQASSLMKVIDVNAKTLELYEARHKEELRGSWEKVCVSATLPFIRNVLIAIAEERTFFRGETLQRTLRDECIHVIISLVIPTTQADFKNLLISVVDVTDRRQLEKALAKIQHDFLNVVMKNNSGILITNHAGIVLFSNPAAQMLLGRRSDELHGAQFGIPVVAGRKTEVDILHPDQGAGIAEMSMTVTEWDGEPAYLTMLHDITERKREETRRRQVEMEIQRHKEMLEETIKQRTEELRVAKEAAEAANRAKSNFMTNISHELRTPLHGVISFARLGIKKNTTASPEKRLHFFQKINESGETLLTLLNDLLDLAKLEAGRMTFEFRQADIGLLIDEVIDEFRPLAAERQLVIEFNKQAERYVVVIDKMKIRQVLRNLFSNAIKFSPEGGHIEVHLEQRDQMLLVSLRDQGTGIPENELETIFDKFTQSSKTKTGAGGTGLGLPICREIIHGHQGKIWAENNPEGGACFYFQLPLELSDSSENRLSSTGTSTLCLSSKNSTPLLDG